jgi:hypothetical protein
MHAVVGFILAWFVFFPSLLDIFICHFTHFLFRWAMYRYACSLGLTAAYRDIQIVGRVIRMCIALPLLPHGRIEEAFQAIQLYAQAVNEVPDVQVRLSVARFLGYIRTFWLDQVGAPRFSVYNQVNRTNNHIESWHRGLNEIMMVAHPGFWVFIGKC